jgi:cob(I)alamin adenosyltransferase
MGKLHVYTGKGKGKTTAAIGLAVRAAGAGMRVLFVQFLKDGASSEFRILAKLPEHIECRFYGQGHFIRGTAPHAAVELARRGLTDCAAAMTSGTYDLIVLDEACAAVETGLFTATELLAMLCRPDGMAAPDGTPEVVVTGRNAPPELLTAADLVTDMRETKHYAQTGCPARRGIEL